MDKRIEGLITNAKMLASTGSYQEAISVFNQAIEIDPTNIALWVSKGNTLIKAALYEEALIVFETIFVLNPNFHLLWNPYQNEFVESLIGIDPNVSIHFHEIKAESLTLDSLLELVIINKVKEDSEESENEESSPPPEDTKDTPEESDDLPIIPKEDPSVPPLYVNVTKGPGNKIGGDKLMDDKVGEDKLADEKKFSGNKRPIITETDSDMNYKVVRTFFATDRNRTEKDSPKDMFGTERSSLTYGVCDVSIPRNHTIGELESPSILRLEFREDPEKHVVLLKTEVKEKEGFFGEIAQCIQEGKTKNAFLFVHGYNVTFEDAARRTGQMAADLDFDGAPVFYSWPSQGNFPSYLIDSQNIEWAQTNLKNFLLEFFADSTADNIYLIAHSMGNRGLTRALIALLKEKPEYKEKLKEVILTAPDIDADVFKRDIAPALSQSGKPITLYASSKDKALIASKKVNGHPRAGDSGEGLLILPGMETIDATGVDTGFLKHSYFAERKSVLSDIYYIVQKGIRADDRFGLERKDTPTGPYWEFRV